MKPIIHLLRQVNDESLNNLLYLSSFSLITAFGLKVEFSFRPF